MNLTSMNIKWLGTTAIVLAISTGFAVAQGEPDMQKRHEQHPAAASPREPSRPAAGAEHPGGAPTGATQPLAREGSREGSREGTREGAREPQRSSAPPSRSQAQEQNSREHQPARQSEELGRGQRTTGQAQEQNLREHQPARQSEELGRNQRTTGQAQPSEHERGARGAEQALEPKRQGQELSHPQNRAQQKLEERAREGKISGESKQQQGQVEPGRGERTPASSTQSSEQERRDRDQRAAEPKQAPERNASQAERPQPSTNPQASNPQARETARPGESERQRETVSQSQDQLGRRDQTSRITVNEDQRKEVVDRLRRDRDLQRENQNVNVRVNVGERLPDSVRPRPLPRDIVEIVPQFRDYDYTVIEDRVAVIDPRTREVVDILDEGGYGDRRDRAAGGYEYGREHFTFTPEQRGLLRREATGTVGSTGGNSACMTLQPVPAELARSHPELASLRYIAIGEQVVLVDPRERKIVQVID